ncbi:RNA-binding protein Rpb16, putative [Bodo saltans]|uniref:RNA-binding protein Rpb16, putative n=1 Tax=Bodo saltans TaxID=75058 RepID=A0A0S4INZ6_BODSA|nr:RNA-binding protein Rpb16, putative [Bodo saltans]|eukprot:CUE98784.1 RNA-binding protein Rpb16, putative [Bodo saltans]
MAENEPLILFFSCSCSQASKYLKKRKEMFRSIALLNRGKVDSWIAHKGFGFIVEEGTNKTYFAQKSGLMVLDDAYRVLTVGQEVEFDVPEDGDREEAINVNAPGGGRLGPRPFERHVTYFFRWDTERK